MRLKFLLSVAVFFSGLLINNAAIIYPLAPDGGQQIAAKHLDLSLLKAFGITNTNNVTLGLPFRGYSFSFSDMASGRLTPTNQPVWWYYPIMEGTNCHICVSLVADSFNTNRLKFATVGGSYSRNSISKTLQIASQLPQITKQDYEVRRLEAIPISFDALWFHAKSDDIIIPMPMAYGRWNAFQPYSEAEIIKLLKPEAEEKLIDIKANPHGFD
jgi:hypothetical protein